MMILRKASTVNTSVEPREVVVALASWSRVRRVFVRWFYSMTLEISTLYRHVYFFLSFFFFVDGIIQSIDTSC